MSITVVDSLMGTGKSTWIRNHMNSHPDKRWWYIAVYLKEASVPTEGCPTLNFQEPSDENKKKGDDLISLIKKGANIASTHQLFLRIKQTPELLDLIKSQGYTLVIDEALDVVRDLSKANDDINGQLQLNTFSVDEQSGLLTWQNNEYKGRDFKDVQQAIQTSDVYYNGDTLISLFKPDIFGAFLDVYVLTYLFDGSRMRMYFDFSGIAYTTCHIISGELSTGEPDNLQEKKRIKELINLYDGPYYDIGITKYARTCLSQSWYNKPQYNKRQEVLFRSTYNYLHYYLKAKSNDTMFTVFKNVFKKNPNMLPSYKKAFVECSAKATNEYRDRFALAYLVNMFQDPEIEKFFAPRGVTQDETAFARCSMLQWIWRSRIRNYQTDPKPIHLFVPSPRMRDLLIEWLDKSD